METTAEGQTTTATRRRMAWWADPLVAVVLAVLVAPVSIEGFLRSDWTAAGQVLGVALLVIAHTVLAVRSRLPLTVLGIVSVAVALLVLAPDLTGGTAQQYGGAFPPLLLPSLLVFPVALHAVAARRSARHALLAAVLGLGGVGLAGARLALADRWPGADATSGEVVSPLSVLLFVAVFVVVAVLAPWSLGRYQQVRAHYVAALEDRAVRAEAERARDAHEILLEERARIARELHDVVSHSLAVMVSQAEGGRMIAQKDPALSVQALDTIARTGQEAMHGMRDMLDALTPATSAGTSPQPTLADLDRLVDRVGSSGLAVAVHEEGQRFPLSESAALATYRIVQESLTNVVKHGGAGANADVTLEWTEDDLVIEVRNDGEVPAPTRPGRGIIGMRERASLLGGTLAAEPLEHGFRVRATIPRTKGAA